MTIASAPPSFTVLTDHPLAAASLDHLYPLGTKQDNSTSAVFLDDMERHFGKRFSLLDLGCAGGQLVRDTLQRGYPAVGIEGSDYSAKAGRAHWPQLGGTNLFTADITKRFTVKRLGGAPCHWCSLFNVITAWDVLEHIAEEDLSILFRNISTHLSYGGLFIGSISTQPSPHPDAPEVDLHVTCRPEVWWRDELRRAGFAPAEGVRITRFVRLSDVSFCARLAG